MDSLLILLGIAVAVCVFVLPIVAIVRTSRIQSLEQRLAGIEAALLRLQRTEQPASEPVAPVMPVMPAIPPPLVPVPPPTTAPVEPARPVAPLAPLAPPPLPRIGPAEPARPSAPPPSINIEKLIGEKWLGWIAVVLILFAAAYFLKYAFDNQWIGELGRVTLGVIIGLAFLFAGFDRHRRGWRYISQVLTGGGITILYLSIYGSFAYYHLVDQRTAFIFLAIVVIEAHLLALLYNAPSIAVMAIAGGFLNPILLSTGRDQYAILFSYIGALDLGALALVLARRWWGIGSLAYVGTQLLFWGWYDEHYHPEKRAAALVFQLFVFGVFMAADLAPRLRRQLAGIEELIRLVLNPFIFFSISYALLNDDQHPWMGAFAVGMAIVYAALARVELSLTSPDPRMVMLTLGTALTFVTLAIPIQLDSNWIAIAWGLEGAALIWVSIETPARLLRVMAGAAFTLALGRYLFIDTPWNPRPLFTPVLNRYFLETAALTACLGFAAYLARRLKPPSIPLWIAMIAAVVLWLGSSFEVYTYCDARAHEIASAPQFRLTPESIAETRRQWEWAAQLSLSVLWSVYAGILTAIGFRYQIRAVRVVGLALFGLTLVKVLTIDISQLQQIYRILALLVLGLVLLRVAWTYQRRLRRERTQ